MGTDDITEQEAVELAHDFTDNKLTEEDWFRKIDKNGDFDLLILTGSTVQGSTDEISDLDLFIVSPLEVQNEYNLPPVSEYHYKGIPVEVSHVTSEKLKSDQNTKNHIYWWKDAKIIRCKDEKYRKILRRAGSYTEEEKREELWTLMILYEAKLIDLERINQRGDDVSFELNFNACLKDFCKFLLLDKNISKRFKWYGRMMKQHWPEVYEEIERVRNKTNNESQLEGLKEFRPYFRQILKENGFSEEEINNWHKNNLTMVKFQKY